MLILAIATFILCPLASLAFVYVGLKKDIKHRTLYLALVAMFIALFSYSYTPTAVEDLYRHQMDAAAYQYSDIADLIEDLHEEPEQVATMYKFLIGKTGNLALLQFFTAAICFFILLYLLNAFTEKNKGLPILRVIGVWAFVLSGFYFIVITSNIFYTLALEIFSLGVYFDYVRKKKVVGAIFYILPVFIHTSAVLTLILIVLFKLFGSKINVRNIVILIVLILSINFLLTTVAANINLPIVSELSNLYRSYFNREEDWAVLHTVPVLTLYLSRLIPIFVAYKFSKKGESMGDFAIFVGLSVLVLFFQTSFSIRYIHVAVLCGLPLLFEMSSNKRYGQFFSVMLYGIAIPHVVYQVHQLAIRTDWGGLENIQTILITNLITSLTRG